MAAYAENIQYIGGRPFLDVTHQTVAGKIYTIEEAIALIEGRSIATSRHIEDPKHDESPPKEHREPFWKQLPKYKKRKFC